MIKIISLLEFVHLKKGAVFFECYKYHLGGLFINIPVCEIDKCGDGSEEILNELDRSFVQKIQDDYLQGKFEGSEEVINDIKRGIRAYLVLSDDDVLKLGSETLLAQSKGNRQ